MVSVQKMAVARALMLNRVIPSLSQKLYEDHAIILALKSRIVVGMHTDCLVVKRGFR